MSTQSTLIDWVSCTWKDAPGIWPYFDDSTARPTPALHHYQLGWTDVHGALAFMGGHNAGLHMEWSGATLNAWRDSGVEADQFIQTLVDSHAKFTRLDIAIDLRRSRLTVSSLIDHCKRRIAELRVRTWEIRGSDNGGLTLYLGSRASLRFCRIYDKRAELAAKMPISPDDWVRVEIELKDDLAHGSAHALLQFGIESVLASHIASVGDFPKLRAWHRMVDSLGIPSPVIASVRKPTNTKKWLVETVAPTLAREMHDPTFRALFSGLLDEILESTESPLPPRPN